MDGNDQEIKVRLPMDRLAFEKRNASGRMQGKRTLRRRRASYPPRKMSILFRHLVHWILLLTNNKSINTNFPFYNMRHSKCITYALNWRNSVGPIQQFLCSTYLVGHVSFELLNYRVDYFTKKF